MTHLRLLSASWPRPVRCADRVWCSEPEWDAPLLPAVPEWDGRTLDWRALFGEMKEFHIVFRVRAEVSGVLVFEDDDGCIVRRDGEIVHEDRDAHSLERHELRVSAGDVLEIAQWQYHGDWTWRGHVKPSRPSLDDDVALFAPFRAAVEEALRRPDGPMLKTYIAAAHPVRAALAIYSLILNGYCPAGVRIYGEYQWDASRRRAIERLLPFAEIVPTPRLTAGLDGDVAALARSNWSAMKICAALLDPPDEFCLLDDDVFVLDSMSDALALHRHHDLVHQTDADHGPEYRRIWSHGDAPLPTGIINTGVCFVRNRRDRRAQARRLASHPPNGEPLWLWEQGFMATEFADGAAAALPTNRYFYPVFDGLPGGVRGYDWAANPCRFATVHFGGLSWKPTDDDARIFARAILGRRKGTVSP